MGKYVRTICYWILVQTPPLPSTAARPGSPPAQETSISWGGGESGEKVDLVCMGRLISSFATNFPFQISSIQTWTPFFPEELSTIGD